MKLLKNIAAISAAAALALTVAACGGSATPASDGGSSDAAPGIVEFTNASGAAVTFDSAFTEGTVEVTLADGEALIIMGTLDSGQVNVLISQDGNEISTDEYYEGSGYSELGIPAGTYQIEFTSTEASGTLYALAYPADTFDVMNTDTEEIIQTVLSNVA